MGAQRHAFFIQAITDWMGDEAFLKACACEYRKFVYLGDAMYFQPRVTAKYIDANGEACVEIESATMNQVGEDVMPSTATVILPTRGGGASPAKRRARPLASL